MTGYKQGHLTPDRGFYSSKDKEPKKHDDAWALEFITSTVRKTSNEIKSLLDKVQPSTKQNIESLLDYLLDMQSDARFMEAELDEIANEEE
jgi:hypothetical protein